MIYDLMGFNEQLKAQVKELTAEVNAQREDHDRLGRLSNRIELLKAQAIKLTAQVKAKQEELDRLERSHKVGYEFGSTGTVIDRDKQVSVVLCLLLHFDKSRGLIIMCHILQYPSSMTRCSESRICIRPATTKIR